MRSLVLLLCLLLVGCGGSVSSQSRPGPSQNPHNPTLIYVQNESQAPHDEVQLGMASVQRQLSGEFFQAWNVSVTLVLADQPSSEDYVVHLRDSAHNGYIGYYQGNEAWVQTTVEGAPLLGWTEVLSHESIEVLMGDICDPVVRPYSIPPGSPSVENFLLPDGRSFLQSIGE